MGEVYLAQDTQLNRKVAIKFLPSDSVASELLAKRRLLREARAAATLDHPNICAVHEVAEENGRTFIVMQYVEGETLGARLKRKPLELSESLFIAGQIADALAEAHSRGIVHRDIKPANIIITPRGQPKVMDFGLAKLVLETVESEADTQSLLTMPGAIVGTMPYMSPEQVSGETVDERTDIFSFGVVLYEMLTGHQPFAATSGVATISAILTKEPLPLTNYLPDCPERLEQILRKCLAKDRHNRYQKIRDVATDLESLRRESQRETSPRTNGVLNQTNTQPLLSRLRFSPGWAAVALVILAVAVAMYALIFKNSTPGSTSSNNSANPTAHDYYIRGKVLVESENREDNEAAVRLLEQAIAADPNFAPAFAALATAYRKKAFFFAPEEEKKKLNLEAEVAVEKALALDSNLAEGHYARGLILWTHANRFPHEQAI